VTWPPEVIDQPQDGSAGGRLAAAGFSDQAQGLATIDLEADVVDGFDMILDGAEDAPRIGKWTLQVLHDSQQRRWSGHGGTVSGACPPSSHGCPIRRRVPTWGAAAGRGRVEIRCCSRFSSELLLDDPDLPSSSTDSMKSLTVGSRL
jgi:hypothetical protein